MEQLFALPVGFAFGALVRNSGVYAPEVIRGQMIFNTNIMLKMFLGGLFGSALSLALLSRYDKHTLDKIRETKGFGDRGIVTSILGGMVQGMGMTISGACPGMVYAQLGAGSESARMVMLGGLLGALVHALLHPWIKQVQNSDFSTTLATRLDSMHLERLFFAEGTGFARTTTALAMVAMSAALAIESLVPSPEIAGYNLPPIVAGMAIGSLQLPLFFALKTFMGMSSGYSAVASQALVCGILPGDCLQEHTYLQGFAKNTRALWQVVFGLGVALGASSLVLDNTAVPTPGQVPLIQSLVGGFLLVFGARSVGGCASGHGLTGLPSLHVESWFVVPSMFAGAMIAGNLMAHFMGKSDYLLVGTHL